MTEPQKHISSAFDQDLIILNESLQELAELACAQFEKAIDALATQNERELDAIISGDKALDLLEAEIHEKALEIIAIRAPRAAPATVVSLQQAESSCCAWPNRRNSAAGRGGGAPCSVRQAYACNATLPVVKLNMRAMLATGMPREYMYATPRLRPKSRPVGRRPPSTTGPVATGMPPTTCHKRNRSSSQRSMACVTECRWLVSPGVPP